ncbi:hypothetical protein M5689_015870 [Euphorbia peplus]|nr:hypothetical protein M5689_015870 [Euphorbia peplus]
MADQYSLCLLTVMDRLWYHQIILFSSSSPSPSPPSPPPSSSSSSSSSLQVSQPLNSNIALQLSNSTLQQNETPSPLSPQENPIAHISDEKEEEEEERPTRMNALSTIRTRRSYSSSTVELRRPRNISRSSSMRALETYSMISSRSLKLEMEEVQGFMDLGFNFNKDNISPKLSSIVPGLLRLNNLKFLSSSSSLSSSDCEKFNDDNDDDSDIVQDGHEDEDEDEKRIMRPYLSEAWLIKRPDSPLLNLKLPRGNSDDSDMKKHLKFWARTVATVIHQESY